MFLDYQQEKASYQLILLLFYVRTSHILKQPQIEVFEKRETNYYSATNKIELVFPWLSNVSVTLLYIMNSNSYPIIALNVFLPARRIYAQ